jgi:hypothetical protein
MCRREGEVLGVGLHVGDVAQPRVVAEPAGPLEHRCGQVHTQSASVDGGASGLTGGLARAATDVEHAVVRLDVGRGAEVRVVEAKLGVVEVGIDVHGSGRGRRPVADHAADLVP